MNYKDHILVIPEFVPNEFCDDVVEIMEQSDLTNAKVDRVLQRTDIQFRGFGMLAEYAQKENKEDK